MIIRCQICGTEHSAWMVTQVEFNIRTLRYYKLQACPACQEVLELAIVRTLHQLERGDKPGAGAAPEA